MEMMKKVMESDCCNAVGPYVLLNMEKLKAIFPEYFREDCSMIYEKFEKEIRPYFHIYYRPDVTSISFTMATEKTPGCAIDALLYFVQSVFSKDDELKKLIQDAIDHCNKMAEKSFDPKVETITISKEEYIQLSNDSQRLEALQQGGVDNWEWYSEVGFKAITEITRDEDGTLNFIYEED